MTAHDRMEADDPLVLVSPRARLCVCAPPRHKHDPTVKICRPAGCLYVPWTKLHSLRVCAHSWGDTCVRLHQQGVGKIHADFRSKDTSCLIGNSACPSVGGAA